MNRRFLIAFLTSSALVFASAGVVLAQGLDAPCNETTTMDCVDWDQGIAFAVGSGAPASWAKTGAQKNISAQRAARIDAARNLIELVKGINISGESSMRDAMLESDLVTSHVEGKVAGLRLVGQPKYFSDGSIMVKMGARLRELVPPELYSTGAPQELAPPTAAGAAAVMINTGQAYTGLIIDAKGTGVLPAMSPKVVDPGGREVYGSAYVSRDYAVAQGIVGYAKEMSAAQQNDRVRGTPLVIKAVRAKGSNKADLVINQADADALRQIAQSQNFMRESRVMIILD